MEIRAEVKKLFFDRKTVTDFMDKKTVMALARAGGLIRTIARQSMRVRKGVSSPGAPPSAHNRLLKDNVFFYADKTRKNVVVGPVLLRRQRRGNRDTMPVPRLLEQGGMAVRRNRMAKYAARPFMGPALKKAEPKIAPEWGAALNA